MQIIKGGYSLIEFDSVSTFTAPKQIEQLLKAGTSFTPKTMTEEFADNKLGSAAKAVDVSIRSANVDDGVASVYAALKAAEDARTQMYFRFVKLLNDDFIVEDCEDAWDESVAANVTSDVDVVDFKDGAKSATLVITNDIAGNTILATEIIAKDLTTYKAVRFWIKHKYGAAAGDLQILLDNTALCASPLEVLPLPALPIDTWKECTLVLKDPSALGSLISIGLKAITAISAPYPIIHIDDVRGVTGHVTVLNNIIPRVNFEQNESGKHNAIKVTGEGFADTEANLLTTNF